MHKYEEAAGGLLELRQPAAEQGSQREGRLVARRDPLPAVVRPARAVRNRSRRGRQALHGRFPAGERQGRRAREGQRRARRRTSSWTPGRRTPSSRGPTAQRLGITPVTYTLSAGVGRVGLRGLQLARIDSLELGSLKLRNVPCLIKNPPLQRYSGEGNRRAVAAGARLLDDHRLQDAQADVRQAPAGRAARLRAADAAAPTRHGARDGRRSSPGELRRGYGRRGDLDQLGHRERARQARERAPDRAEGVRHVGLGSATRSCCRAST